MFTALSLLVLFVTVIVSAGLSLLHLSGFRARYAADMIVAAFGVGLSVIGLIVYLLLLLNAYVTPAAVLLVLAPLFYVFWQIRLGKFSELIPEERNLLAGLPAKSLDRAAALICFSFIAVGVVDCLSSPMTHWDAIASWDKWATEWALRTNMYGRLLGYYPQLLPMTTSVLYKITATAQETRNSSPPPQNRPLTVRAGYFC